MPVADPDPQIGGGGGGGGTKNFFLALKRSPRIFGSLFSG